MAGKPHRWTIWRAIMRPVCMYCGLVWLKNKASGKAAGAACPGTQEEPCY